MTLDNLVDGIEHVTSDDFDDKVKKNNKPTFVDFYATWCGPCKKLAPVLDELAEEYSDLIDFFKVDENQTELHKEYDIKGFPTLKLFDGEEVVLDILGNRTKDQLKDLFDDYLGIESVDDKNSPDKKKKSKDKKEALYRKIERFAQGYATKKGFDLNPDSDTVEGVIEGLMHNVRKHGKLYCPCRPVSGDPKKDKKNMCPCDYHLEEIKEDGNCHCQLFYEKKDQKNTKKD